LDVAEHTVLHLLLLTLLQCLFVLQDGSLELTLLIETLSFEQVDHVLVFVLDVLFDLRNVLICFLDITQLVVNFGKT